MVRFLASLCCQRLEDWQKFDEGKPSILKPEGKTFVCVHSLRPLRCCASPIFTRLCYGKFFFFSITKLGFEVVEKPLASCSFVQ